MERVAVPAGTSTSGGLVEQRRVADALSTPVTSMEGRVMSHVLVTGGSGFIAGHIILQLLEQGHTVRSTIRSLRKEQTVRSVLREAGAMRGEALSFVEADLTADLGWAEAAVGIDYVLHVASPVHTGKVRHEDDVIAPARDGAVRVLRAARDAGVRRTVLTSAFHAVGFGQGDIGREYTEDDWTPLHGRGVDAYGRSKVLAERAAWDFISREGRGMELTAILPVAVMGPVMGTEISGANHIVQRSLAGQMPGYPNMYVPVVDVRDVAAAHVAAMTAAAAAGERILLGTGEPATSMHEIGAILRKDLGQRASKVPTRSIPDLVVRAAAVFSSEFRPVAADLGNVKRVSTRKARAILGTSPRPVREAIEAAGRSMVARDLV
jgi:nucleoside-diphosphate-sugar epimerase